MIAAANCLCKGESSKGESSKGCQVFACNPRSVNKAIEDKHARPAVETMTVRIFLCPPEPQRRAGHVVICTADEAWSSVLARVSELQGRPTARLFVCAGEGFYEATDVQHLRPDDVVVGTDDSFVPDMMHDPDALVNQEAGAMDSEAMRLLARLEREAADAENDLVAIEDAAVRAGTTEESSDSEVAEGSDAEVAVEQWRATNHQALDAGSAVADLTDVAVEVEVAELAEAAEATEATETEATEAEVTAEAVEAEAEEHEASSTDLVELIGIGAHGAEATETAAPAAAWSRHGLHRSYTAIAAPSQSLRRFADTRRRCCVCKKGVQALSIQGLRTG